MRYTREDGCRAWFTWATYRSERAGELLEEMGSAESIYDRFVSQGPDFLKEYLSARIIESLTAHATPEAMHEMMVTMNRRQIGILSQSDFLYPESLRSIPSPPALLFYQGNLNCLVGRLITIIGSRAASTHGVEAAQQIASDLSRAGVTIVSGLAIGLDAAAHQGSLNGGSPTIAVTAAGLDVDYPAENSDIREAILRHNGLLLSELPLGMKSDRYVFQSRNRIMSGLSKATAVVECKITSGCMLTVQHALDQGREVLAYPGVPNSEWSEGTHQLIREGARYFTNAQDILEDMNWDQVREAPVMNERAAPPALTEVQLRIVNALQPGALSFDQLADKLSMSAPQLSSTLTMLQMMGLVRALPGKTYERI